MHNHQYMAKIHNCQYIFRDGCTYDDLYIFTLYSKKEGAINIKFPNNHNAIRLCNVLKDKINEKINSCNDKIIHILQNIDYLFDNSIITNLFDYHGLDKEYYERLYVTFFYDELKFLHDILNDTMKIIHGLRYV